MAIVSHISSELTEWECELFIKAISTKGIEATGAMWLEYWFDYKNNPKNVIREDLKNRIIQVAEKHSYRIAKALFKISNDLSTNHKNKTFN